MRKSDLLMACESELDYTDIDILPYEKIHKGAKVIIYGAGYVGKRYVDQIVENGYFDLVCVVDKNADELCSDVVRLDLPSALDKYDFDYLLIAIKDTMTADEIRRDLMEKYNVPKKKIVWKGSMKYPHIPFKCIWPKLPNAHSSRNEILISAFIGGGFGDAVISKKIIGALREVAGPFCSMDLYVHDITYSFTKGLFRECDFVKNVYRESVYSFSRYCNAYDLSIVPVYILIIEHYDYESLQRKNPAFAECVIKLKNCLDKAGLNYVHKVDNAVLYARAKKRGYNAYTIHSYDGILPIKDTRVEIPLLKEREKEYKDILSKIISKDFVTINYGWGANDHKDEYIPAKIWPFDYYVRLVELIKNKYCDIGIVQIGRGNTPKIPNVDVYLRDLDIEIIKYVLKDSIMHIDSEGGMVHLATQLGTKCLVAFGPTPVHFFGYESNMNVVSDKCSDCYFLDDDFASCFRGMDKPECMYSIKPEMMFEKFDKCLRDIGYRTLNII